MKIALINQLDKLQSKKNEGLGVSCVRDIVFYLKRNDIENAKAVWCNDGDKIHQYSDIKNFLIEHLGCRIHGVKNCISAHCKDMRNV